MSAWHRRWQSCVFVDRNEGGMAHLNHLVAGWTVIYVFDFFSFD